MICTHCGANVPEGTKFCTYCGAEMKQAASAVPTDRFRPLSPWEYWGLTILYSVPIVGLVFMIIFSFSNANIHRRNFTRSFWCTLAVVLIVIAVLAATGVAGGIIYGLF